MHILQLHLHQKHAELYSSHHTLLFRSNTPVDFLKIFLTHVLMFELFMYVYSCNALSARFFAVDRALNSYFMIMIMIIDVRPHPVPAEFQKFEYGKSLKLIN